VHHHSIIRDSSPSRRGRRFHRATPNSSPNGITVGPDGNLGFAQFASSQIARITPDGAITEYPVPTAGSAPSRIVAGPDGNLWFTEFDAGQVGRFDPVSETFDEFPVGSGTSSGPAAITAGGGELYVGLQGDNGFAVVDTDGTQVEAHELSFSSVPAGLLFHAGSLYVAQAADDRVTLVERAASPFEELQLPDGESPGSLAIGADGNVWYTGQQHIGRVTPTGDVTRFAIPTADSAPLVITAGPDGHLWFTESAVDQIGRVATDGTITEFALPDGAAPEGITAGPDGNLWITGGTDQVRVMGTDGAVRDTYTTPTPNSDPSDITVGPDGRLWLSAPSADELVASTTGGQMTAYPVPSGTQPQGLTAHSRSPPARPSNSSVPTGSSSAADWFRRCPN
jgi:streptogramin lyase